jgi:hypothetical protein
LLSTSAIEAARDKGEQVAVDGVRIVMNAQRDQPIIVLPSGSYQWQRFSGEFTMPGIADVIHPLSASIEIVSTAPGKVWLDDLRIERIAP